MSDLTSSSDPAREVSQPVESAIGISDEPFPCPACGQMLAPTVRVCVACKRPIDRAEVIKSSAAQVPIEIGTPTEQVPLVPYPWALFFVLLSARFLAFLVLSRHVGLKDTWLALGAMEIVTASWVFFDARGRGVPKPFRWALGSLFLWIIIFPWYLRRRASPQARCLFVEAEAGPVARALLGVLLFLFLLFALVFLIKSPPQL